MVAFRILSSPLAPAFKESTCNVEDNPRQYPCLKKLKDIEAWQAIVQRVTKSDTTKHSSKKYDYDTFYALAHGYFDSERGILMPRILPIIAKKSENSDIDYFSNLHEVWKKMNKMTEEKILIK